MSVGVLGGQPVAADWYTGPRPVRGADAGGVRDPVRTRRIDAALEHHRGMVLAIALESLVKLVAFVAIGRCSRWRTCQQRRRYRLPASRPKAGTFATSQLPRWSDPDRLHRQDPRRPGGQPGATWVNWLFAATSP